MFTYGTIIFGICKNPFRNTLSVKSMITDGSKRLGIVHIMVTNDTFIFYRMYMRRIFLK